MRHVAPRPRCGAPLRNVDLVYRDLIFRTSVRDADRRAGVALLRAVSPHLPAPVAATLDFDLDVTDASLELWEARFQNEPTILQAIGNFHLRAGRYDEALRCFTRRADVAPGHDAFVKRASVDEQFDDESRSASRDSAKSDEAWSNLGFRVVREVQ